MGRYLETQISMKNHATETALEQDLSAQSQNPLYLRIDKDYPAFEAITETRSMKLNPHQIK